MTTSAPAMMCATSACCHKPHFSSSFFKEDRMEKAFRIAEKVCAVALGALAAMTSFWLFVPSFILGAVVGVATYKKTHDHNHHHDHKAEGGSCSHGFIEQTTGVKVPRSLALLSGFAVMAVHIDHHAPVFVPIVGLSLGLWAGNLAAPSMDLCFKKIQGFILRF